MGCSVGLFWNICDSFYLVDPFHGGTVKLDVLLASMGLGVAGYMEGLRITSSKYEDGFIEGSQPARRYSVSRQGEPQVKRLSFVTCGTSQWLKTTPSVKYSVAICKDYEGITGASDQKYPHEEIWGRLNRHGIFAETIGAARSNEAFDFAKYKFYGFTPLFKVTKEDGDQIGFGAGLCLFQKNDSATKEAYCIKTAYLEDIEVRINAALYPFFGELVYGPSALEDETYVKDPSYIALHKIMTEQGINTWTGLHDAPQFLAWLRTRLSGGGMGVGDDLLFEFLAPFKFEMLGGWSL